MAKIPTAEELYHSSKGGNVNISKKQFTEAVKKYAKLHVKAALEAADKQAEYEFPENAWEDIEDKNFILNAYPENLIQ